MSETNPGWRRSSRCSAGNCVEVETSMTTGLVMVRDSADPGRNLRFTPREWAEFVAGVRAGEFDVEESQ